VIGLEHWRERSGLRLWPRRCHSRQRHFALREALMVRFLLATLSCAHETSHRHGRCICGRRQVHEWIEVAQASTTTYPIPSTRSARNPPCLSGPPGRHVTLLTVHRCVVVEFLRARTMSPSRSSIGIAFGCGRCAGEFHLGVRTILRRYRVRPALVFLLFVFLRLLFWFCVHDDRKLVSRTRGLINGFG